MAARGRAPGLLLASLRLLFASLVACCATFVAACGWSATSSAFLAAVNLVIAGQPAPTQQT